MKRIVKFSLFILLFNINLKAWDLNKIFIREAPKNKIVHAPCIASLGNGMIMICWYEGSKEGGKDVKILGVKQIKGIWQKTKILMDTQKASKDLGQRIKTLGNPLIQKINNRTFFYFVSVSYGGWAGSSINVCTSQNNGDEWSKVKKLKLSNFFNVSFLLRNNGIYENKTFILPIYNECITTYPALLLIKEDKYFWKKVGDKGLIQGQILKSNNTYIMLYRSIRKEPYIYISKSLDLKTWSKPQKTDFLNPNSAMTAKMIDKDKILLIFNNSKKNRENLCMSISDLEGKQKTNSFFIEKGILGDEFSYPFLIKIKDEFHLVYTYKRKKIVYIKMNKNKVLNELIYN